MDPTKTRIWNADMLGLHAVRPSPSERRGTLPPPRVPAASPPPPASQCSTDAPACARMTAASPPPPPPRALAAKRPPSGASARVPLATTRIMPIESLFPRAQAAHTQTTPVAPAPRLRTLKRIGTHVLLASLTVLAIAVWKLPLRPQVRASSEPVAAATAHVEARSAQSNQADAAATTHATPALPARAPPSLPKAPPRAQSLERRAVELVIAGDFLGAEQAYRALALARANKETDASTFREAARILAARQRP